MTAWIEGLPPGQILLIGVAIGSTIGTLVEAAKRGRRR